ncbi:lysine--tRNA ligase [Bartonella sp. DGB1]|uniref:lysine--tRNA ligase n=1 Tax=Bartonella sp. DGB1 TaxID=3239807 RepID=UPI0035267A70
MTISSNNLALSNEMLEAASNSKAWPFEEAKKIIKRYEKTGFPEVVLFETGYGPSGLPHIGTFGEVARTNMVRFAFRVLTNDTVKTKLICFSDDRDALRKVPENVPNRDKLAESLGKPLTMVPDPFDSEYTSFGHANNARLRAFLDQFGFEYEFASATDYYLDGRFDQALLQLIAVYDKVMQVMLPTLGEERQASYSPFLPVSPNTGKVLQVPINIIDVEKGIISYIDPDNNQTIETVITGGNVKCQWKADWALRWYALKIDYEMSGKDLIPSVQLATKICKLLGGNPPEGFSYELFLDEKGGKISKSKGNGLSIEEWLRYAPTESLSLYMYQKPKTAKRLYFDVIPKAVDEYYSYLAAWKKQTPVQIIENPLFHIHNGCPPEVEMPVSFALLLNLVSASNAENANVLWGFISSYAEGVTPATAPELDKLVNYALRYFNDFILPQKKYRKPDNEEIEVLQQIIDVLQTLPVNSDSNVIQNNLLMVARRFERYHDPVKKSPDGGVAVAGNFFQMLYQTLLGQEKGPRFGSFIALYGIEETVKLIQNTLER